MKSGYNWITAYQKQTGQAEDTKTTLNNKREWHKLVTPASTRRWDKFKYVCKLVLQGLPISQVFQSLLLEWQLQFTQQDMAQAKCTYGFTSSPNYSENSSFRMSFSFFSSLSKEGFQWLQNLPYPKITSHRFVYEVNIFLLPFPSDVGFPQKTTLFGFFWRQLWQ